MPDELLQPTATPTVAQQAPAPKYPLTHEPANDAARTQVDRNLHQMLNHNAVKPLMTVEGVPIQKREYIGAQLDLIGAQDEKARKTGSYFLVAEQTQGGHTGQIAYPLVVPPDMLARLESNKATEQDTAWLSGAVNAIKAVAIANNAVLTGPISIGKPQDCLQFVNGALTSNNGTVRVVNPDTGVEINEALASSSAIIETKPNLAKPNAFMRPPFSYKDGVNEFAKEAKPGDVVVILDKKQFNNLKEARAWETQTHDQVLWLDANNHAVDTSAMKDTDRPPGTPFIVGHTAVYSGTVDGKPMMAQSHIADGGISTQPIADYLHGWVNDAIAIVPLDYFAK